MSAMDVSREITPSGVGVPQSQPQTGEAPAITCPGLFIRPGDSRYCATTLPHELPSDVALKSCTIAPDYFAARQRFIQASTYARADLSSHEVPALGPKGEPLLVDIAYIGASSPRAALVLISGTHGIEGLSGSAIQSEILRSRPRVPRDGGILFVHALNPYGMAHVRRSNEENVDLNRNWLPAEATWSGAPPGYEKLGDLLDPDPPPRRIGLFTVAATWNIVRHGLEPLEEALLAGQYDHPRGLFFGGQSRQASIEILEQALSSRLKGVEHLVGIDFHTGLGGNQKETILVDSSRLGDRMPEIAQTLQRTLRPRPDIPHHLSANVRGALFQQVPNLFPAATVDWFVHETGTHNPIYMLRAMIDENRLHMKGAPTDLNHWAKRAMLEAFAPENKTWRVTTLRQGTSFTTNAMTLAFGDLTKKI